MTATTRRRATVLLGVLFSVPAYRTWSDGGIDLDTLAIRVAVAMVVALMAVTLVGMLLDAYAPDEVEPAPAPRAAEGDIEDAVVVEPPQEP